MLQRESQEFIVAKMCRHKEGTSPHVKRMGYSIIDPPYILCVDKEDIIKNLLYACKSVLEHTTDKVDMEVIENEILQLKRILKAMNPFVE